MLADPVVRNHGRVVVTHDALSDVINTVLVVAFVHLRDSGFVGLNVREIGGVVILPDVVEAVDVVRAGSSGEIASSRLGWEFNRNGGVAGTFKLGLRDADQAVYAACYCELARYECWGGKAVLTLHQVVPCFLDCRRRRSFPRRLVPERAVPENVLIRIIDGIEQRRL